MIEDSDIWTKVFRKKDDLVSRRIADETLIIPIAGELAGMQKIFALNPVGDYIWQQIDGVKNLGLIRDGILATFEVEKEQACADIGEFVDELFKRDLIEEAR